MRRITEYEGHFSRQLLTVLTELEIRRKSILQKVIISKVLSIIMVIMFLSIFVGFLNAFPFQDFDMGFAIYIFEGFFYFVLSLVVVMLMYKSVKYILQIKGEKEILRNKQRMYLYSVLLAIVVIFCAFLVGKAYLGEKVFGGLFFIKWAGAIFSIIILGLLSNYFGAYEKKFNLTLKKETLPKILHFIDPRLKYEPDAFIRQVDFVDSRLFPNKDIHSFAGSDFVTGSYGEGLFAFSQLNVREISRTNSQGKSETKITDLFKGLFYVADFNKPFKGKTVIYPDYARTLLGAQFGEMLNHAMQFDNNHLVTLEDVEFEKSFAVYSSDQVEARYILSPTMIEKIKNIRQKLDSDLYFSFINNRVYIAIPGDVDLLVPFIFRDLTQFESLEPIYFTIDSLLDIAQDLQLNTRIWGQE